MKRSFLLLSSFTGVLIISCAFLYISNLSPKKGTIITRLTFPDKITERLALHAGDAKQFVKQHQFNKALCLFVDMSIESGKKRLFIYDLQKDSVVDAGLVTHGRCNESWLVGRKYGNKIGCGCTSLGKYRIGHPYKGRFGLAYKLTGLDTTNNNAFKRYVVLHAHECVPEDEVHPYPICQSDGCPTVSRVFLKKLAGIIDESPQPVMLWIYD